LPQQKRERPLRESAGGAAIRMLERRETAKTEERQFLLKKFGDSTVGPAAEEGMAAIGR
jgi:hypothetical protein